MDDDNNSIDRKLDFENHTFKLLPHLSEANEFNVNNDNMSRF